ncbi:hybrid sensor histidine kinase/response regulator [Vibrio genomosp. F10 str. ZF-129]|uniref:histidine kinase n=3 Tax=Vibrio genomosp. F10 TaxID=723171 RepID=A0A1E5BB44_9VIBR|nr:hybrid sensor histidine kinase/response regulator [Vibrio genomosp. F10]OEE31343.1 hybrid sensor histidine kinase/response regulator [Vibrio genomosp. F10 str. ZF-129]
MTLVNKIYKYAEPNLNIVGWMGFVGFPFYYYIWSSVFPQPYENLPLRIVCSLALLMLALRDFVPRSLHKYLPHYYVWAIALCLPFFFSFMLMMNDWSIVWVMSFMASIFLHILLVHETRILVMQCVVSIGCAILASYFVGGQVEWHEIDWSYVPIFVFTYMFGNIFYFRNQMEHESKIALAKSFGAGIAHEMRNPLSALKATIDLLKTMLVDHSVSAPTPSEKDQKIVSELLDDASEIIKNGNEAIDLLLTSIDENRVSRSTFSIHTIEEVLSDAINSYPYKSLNAKDSVVVSKSENFEFLGSDTLLKYALYNLFKNAFYYQGEETFRLDIRVESTHEFNVLSVRDNGVGIEKEKIGSIFNDFYTFGKNGSFGLGLPFCRRVMLSFGGDIVCHSEKGEWTEFVLMFPKCDSDGVKDIKLDLIRNKSILSINVELPITKALNDGSFYRGYSFQTVSLSTALNREEYQFEYDLIFVDLDEIDELALALLEDKLSFTEAKIVYLYQPDKHYHSNFNRFLSCCAVSKKDMTLSLPQTLERLFFVPSCDDKNAIPKKTMAYTSTTVLLVDDNDSLRSLTTLLLTQQGFQVVEAKDGSEVFKLVDSEDVDIIIMDIEMPHVDGYKATQILRASGHIKSNIPIIGHTGNNSQECIDQMKHVGMNDYVIKPATKDALLEKIEHYV